MFMKQSNVSRIVFGIALALAMPVFALSYTGSWNGGCVSLSRDLSVGSRGSDVSQLQRFLVAQNFSGSGSWMVTGYFGNATLAAVRDYQLLHSLPVSGVADATLRNTLSTYTCGSTSYYQTTSNGSWWNPYGYSSSYSYTYGTSLNLSMLSANTGYPGQSVTVYGTGFDATNNTLYFGSNAITGLSSNGTSLTFTIPNSTAYAGTQSVNLYVVDSRGTSNTLSFTVYGGYYGCNSSWYGYNNSSCACSNGYPWYTSCTTTTPVQSGSITAPTVSYLSPSSGAVGTSVTVFGSGFTSTNNSVRFGTGVIASLNSIDGTTLSFTVPSSLSGYGTQNMGLGSYPVSVTNGSGYTTNQVSFTVTSLNASGSLSLSAVSGPSSLAAGQSGSWTVTVTNPTGSSVIVSPSWGDAQNSYYYTGLAAPQQVSAYGQTTLTFSHTYAQSGSYTINFVATSNTGATANATASVSVSGTTNVTGAPVINSIYPSQGYVGQSVTITGTNLYGTNTVRFGSGALQNVTGNGSSITFTVPSYLSPYCATGYACPMYAQLVTAGTYQITVVNQYGTSNSVSFAVLQ